MNLSVLSARRLAIGFTLFSALIMGGCSSTANYPTGSLNGLPVAEPHPTRFAYEFELAKLNEVLGQELDAEQRGQLLYRRGALYDLMGLRTLARIDLNHALEYQPRNADAYNILGIHYTVLGETQYAFDALDAAIELAPNHEFAYLNRGIAAYYGGRIDLATQDMQRFLAADASDPYRILWLYFAEAATDPKAALTALRQRAQQVNRAEWAHTIVLALAEQGSEVAFLQEIPRHAGLDPESLDERELRERIAERLCEAYFYFGKAAQLRGDDARAELYFKLALSTNVVEFVEHRYAAVELARQ